MSPWLRAASAAIESIAACCAVREVTACTFRDAVTGRLELALLPPTVPPMVLVLLVLL